MTSKTIQLRISFEVLLEAIASLELEEKRKLQQLLNREIAKVESEQSSQFQLAVLM